MVYHPAFALQLAQCPIWVGTSSIPPLRDKVSGNRYWDCFPIGETIVHLYFWLVSRVPRVSLIFVFPVVIASTHLFSSSVYPFMIKEYSVVLHRLDSQ